MRHLIPSLTSLSSKQLIDLGEDLNYGARTLSDWAFYDSIVEELGRRTDVPKDAPLWVFD